MSGLEESFYILGIIFMGIMLVLIGLLLISVIVIRLTKDLHGNRLYEFI
jgi:hypothetical protein